MNFSLIFVLFCFPLWAEKIQVPTVVIEEEGFEAKSHVDHNSIFKVEKVSKKKIKSPQSKSLGDVIKDQVGVESQSYCANCGAKRLTINGLKGEHTSVLIDGLPLHSAVSSFYGVDNIPTIGIGEIQVMRGAGASLANPEAIGGTLNLLTVDPLESKSFYKTSLGVSDRLFGQSHDHSFLYSSQTESKTFGYVLGGQYSISKPWDEDKNGISESPQRENYSFMGKTRFLLGKKNNFTMRLGHSNLEILGGAADPTKPNDVAPLSAVEEDFVRGRVDEKYIGDPLKITDWVELTRIEFALTGTHALESLTLDWNLGLARQEQQSIYQHGFDYANIDHLFVNELKVSWSLGENGLLTLGENLKIQKLRSASETLFEQGTVKKDNFDFVSVALYAQYNYFLAEKFEFDFALRADQLNINWLDLENKINKTILAPRLQALHYITSHLTQRFSYGLGYRAPLTFFESQHGNNESGYEVDIDELEKAHSLVYSLSQNTPDYYITAGIHYTYLENMAYGFEPPQGGKIFYRNSDEDYNIWVSDLLMGYRLNANLMLEGSAEFFQYEDKYKKKLPTAAIEQRYQLKSSYNRGRWGHTFQVNMVGGRDLSKYGSYDEHDVDRDFSSEPVRSPNLTLKKQESPFYFTLDTSLSYEFYKSFVLSFSINNILDYTQTGAGDSPAAWHWHVDHAHFDQLHTWGPNRGREFFLSLSGEF